MINPVRDDFIVDWYEECSVKAIADYLGISVDSVYSRAYRLGLSRKKDRKFEVSNRDIWLMQKLVGHLQIRDIAFKFNMTIEECERYLKVPMPEMIL